MIIEIRHISGRQFELRRGTASCGSAEITPPEEVKLPSYGDTNLAAELIWYMEDYMRRPFGKENEHAHAVEDALKSWGRSAFDALFVRDGYTWYTEAKKAADGMQLRIVSDSPSVLSWPWEALCDKDDYITLNSSIERQTTDIQYQSQKPDTAEGGLNILFVISRPNEGDINYHFLSRDVVELISKDDRQINIDVLRPPTFENLRNALRSKRYHIVHFDGHGGYGSDPTVNSDSFKGAEGMLCFEKIDGEIDPVGAEKLGQLLSNCGVPMMVLNACQSAMVDDRAESPYASVAASLIRAGVRSVVAMGYSLFTGGAKAFVPAFYKELFKSGNAESAVMMGRAAMYEHTSDSYPLSDWIVPQLYQQAQQGERVLPDISGLPTVTRRSRLPKGARLGDTGFIGRGQAIQELERMMLRDKAAMLIYGFAGQGKTTLAQGFLWWLENTGGLDEKDEQPVLWLDFRKVNSAETVIIDILCFAGKEMPTSLDEKIELATNYLKSHRKIIVWDNFESASGKGDSSKPNLTAEDMNVLVELVKELKGGKSKIIITSRDDEEEQFSGFYCSRQKRPLEGLEGGELWSFCQTVAESKNVKLDRDDEYLETLLEKLDGNPLAIRAVLLRLDKVSTKQLLEDFDKAFAGDESDEATRRIRASFKVMCQGAEPEFEPIFQVLSMFEHYADIWWVICIVGNLLNYKQDSSEGNNLIEAAFRCFSLISTVGFVQHENGTVFRLHPALRGCLAEAFPPDNDMRRMFVQWICYEENEANNVTQDRIAFACYHDATCRQAKTTAWKLIMRDEYLLMTYALLDFARYRGSLREYEELLLELADKAKLWGDDDYENFAYSRLSTFYGKAGNDALYRDYAQKAAEMAGSKSELTAKDWYDIGNAAYSNGNYAEAIEAWEKAEVICEQEGNDRVLLIYGMLFSIAVQTGNNNAVEKYKAILEEYAEKGEDNGAKAVLYNSLGYYAENENKAAEALYYYMKSLELFREIGDRYMTIAICIDIGQLLIKRPQAARSYFEEALSISSDIKNESWQAEAYLNLGIDFAVDKNAPNQRALDHLNKAMKIYKKLNKGDKIEATQELIDAINAGEFD